MDSLKGGNNFAGENSIVSHSMMMNLMFGSWISLAAQLYLEMLLVEKGAFLFLTLLLAC